jgi:N-methylhydantoinase B/oxoprolinase/acetone carboxylase alpha subunit
VAAGEVIRIVGPNAGGYGDPRLRDPALVLADWMDQHVTVEQARQVYATVIDADAVRVDIEATKALRRG